MMAKFEATSLFFDSPVPRRKPLPLEIEEDVALTVDEAIMENTRKCCCSVNPDKHGMNLTFSTVY